LIPVNAQAVKCSRNHFVRVSSESTGSVSKPRRRRMVWGRDHEAF
jgi:hypothetical protein